VVPAPFTTQLCGYRENGNPNTSDNNDRQSKDIGHALFRILDVPEGQVGPTDAGAALEEAVRGHLASIRPDLEIQRSRPAFHFEQYAHMSVFPTFRRSHSAAETSLARLLAAIDRVGDVNVHATLASELEQARANLRLQDALVVELISHMPEEALLKVDVTVAETRPLGLPIVHAAISSKWSLRTDRAQDCVSQGAKLVAQRRGRMPHFAVVTIEPRPAMLKILGDGSGSIDCVYHLNLPALTLAWESLAANQKHPETWSPYRSFRRLVDQRRLRDYDDLVAEVARVPLVEAPGADPGSI